MDKENFKTLYQKVNNFKRDADIETLCVIRNEVVNPLISFVVPTCGRVDTLRDTLNSIIAQDNNGIDYEIIVMDNSCDFTDSNPVYVFLQELNSNRIAYFQNKKNLGFDGNSNRGVLMSRGEWISFVHDDDMITPDYFVQIKKYIER